MRPSTEHPRSEPWLLFLHGINTSPEDPWLQPLNDSITRSGGGVFPPARVITPDYRAILRGEVNESPASPSAWTRPGKMAARAARTAYLSRAAMLQELLAPFAAAAPGWVQSVGFEQVPANVPLIEDARRYLRTPDVKNSVLATVLSSLAAVPRGSRLIIVGHSLGSVVAADLIKKLPNGLQVAGLLTIGSPLGAVAEFRSRDLDDFPFDRLLSWVNIFEPRDPVTGARGLGASYPYALDLPVALQNWFVPVAFHQHGAEYYCTHPAAGAAIVGMLRQSELAVVGAEPSLNVKGLELMLLQSLYLKELAKQLPPDDAERLARFERARRVTATSHAAAAASLHQNKEAVFPLPAAEFLTRPDAHIRGAWDDATLLALAIPLAGGPPAPPFKIEEKWATTEREKALVAALSLVRDQKSSVTEVDLVDAIFAARTKVEEEFAPARGLAPTALVVAGVVTLALTGVGLWTVIPAGLAGAAVVTSTLAAFGPGGMIGGMATLAALASAGSAMAVAGVVHGIAGKPRPGADLMLTALHEAIASGSLETLRSLIISLLTLVSAQERLGFTSQRDRVLLACLSAESRLTLLTAEHEAIDPRSDAAKTAKEMLALLRKGVRWLRGEDKPDSDEARGWNQIATRYAAALAERPEAPRESRAALVRRRAEPRAITEGTNGSAATRSIDGAAFIEDSSNPADAGSAHSIGGPEDIDTPEQIDA